eukprot:1369967-Amorphochlora_amoeboformis.AAC.2
MAADLEGYAKLVGEKFQYYVAKTTFILGRKAKKEHKLADNEEFFCISEQKNISRKVRGLADAGKGCELDDYGKASRQYM